VAGVLSGGRRPFRWQASFQVAGVLSGGRRVTDAARAPMPEMM
jgi:hypothetical protein